MKQPVLLLFAVLFFSYSWAQKGSVTGKLTDTTGKQPLAFATVAIFHAKDTVLVSYRLSDPAGAFKVPGIPVDDSFRVIITHAGSAPYRRTFMLTPGKTELDLGVLKLEPDARMMEEVLVVAERPPVLVRRDTIEFNAEAFKTLPSALVEDLLRKLPGVEVDETGNITVNGRKVNRLYVDGKEFFGSDPKMATRNLPANIIDKIQVTDDKDQLAQNPDIAPGQVGQVINLKLKKAIKKGWFGKAYAGAGTDERYEAGAIANLFRDTLQVSLLGYTNNLNRPGFGFSDINSIGGFNRSGINSMMVMSDGGFALNGVSFGGTGQGIQRSGGGGININNQFGKKLTVNLQYFYGEINSNVQQLTNRKQFFGDTTMITSNRSMDDNTNYTHRIAGVVKWTIDSLSTLELRPSLGFVKLQGQNDMNYHTSDNYNPTLNESRNRQRTRNNSTEFGQQLFYRKNFRKKGRNLSVFGDFRLSGNDNNLYNDVENSFMENQQPVTTYLNQLRARALHNEAVSVHINYTEPVSKKLSLQFSERFEQFSNRDNIHTYTTGNNEEYDVPDESLSNGFKRAGVRNNVRGALVFTHKKLSVTPGINYQLLHINNSFEKNMPVQQRFNYILPSLNIRYDQFQVNYSVNAAEPNVNDLQPVEDNTNPIFIQMGNPFLKPSINHAVNLNFYKYNMKTSTNYNAYLYGSISKDAIIRSRTIDAKGVQVSTPVNANGIWFLQASMNISKQLKFSNAWKFTYGGRIWANYRKGLIILNEKRSVTDNISLNPGLNISFNWQDKFEWRQNYGLGWNKAYYRNNGFPGLNVLTHNSGSEIIVRMPKHWVWESSVNYLYNPQVSPGIQKSALRWNAAVNFLFLKEDKGQLKLSVYDLLNQNITVYRQVSENYINDVETNILRRYIMLTFTYNIRNLGGKVGGKERLFMF
ncbi:MAG: outer membrane beta-barrel protein [Chitinophagaceae bacterium]|nr:outer membrane beta-barrel protein [Chitinophagaceae bacterium]